jgi:hypothetical protein
MALPTKLSLSLSRPELPLHSELMQVAQYREFVIYSALACPAVLALPPVLMLFTSVASDCLVVRVHRGMQLNVHTELDTLAGWFPPKGFDASLPKDMKLKKLAKELSKEATLHCGPRHRQRRLYVLGELRALVDLM